jgi:hypothetical protein
MATRILRLVLALTVVSGFSAPAFGQGATSSLTGTVRDSGGGVIPGATVEVKNNATGIATPVVTNSSGVYTVPALPVGTFTVTVTLSGFKTYTATNVRLLAGTPAELNVTLDVGALTETVEVRGGTELVQTQSPTVRSTISVEQISNLPLVSRNALYFATFLPGVETLGGPRGSTIMGLPQNTINITIDGVSNSNNFQSGDGFFSLVTPRLDAVEEVTVTGAAPGADQAAGGAVQIAFVTRSGTNQFTSSVYHYMRHPAFNTNNYMNIVRGLDRNEVIVHQYGGRIGGPIILPGLLDGRGKAFFFGNYEHFYQPTEVTRQRTLLSPGAESGSFLYTVGDETRQVDLLALAASTGNTATKDPLVQAYLARMRTAASSTGTIDPNENPLTLTYFYQAPSKRNEYAPTGRVDFNLTPQHRLSGSYYWQRFHSNPDILNSADPVLPGFPNYGIQASYRTTGAITLRSTLGSNLVNEARGGWQWSPVDFFGNVDASHFEHWNGFAVSVPLVSNVTVNNPQPRNTVNYDFANTLNWLKGNHSFTFGGTFQRITHDQNGSNIAPTIGFGLRTQDDPAAAMFVGANFPGASNNQLGNARLLYAMLTGRVTSIGGTARLSAETGDYVYLGNLNQKSKFDSMGLFVQDSWRMTPTVTLNAGARWEVIFPFRAITNTWSQSTMADLCGPSGLGSGPDGRQCNLFQPGNLPSGAIQVPTYTLYEAGTPGYNTDYKSVSPNVGIAWRPNVQSGFMRAILGDPEQATVRAGYSMAFNRERVDRFTDVYGTNPGGTTPATRSTGATAFPIVLPGETWPVLFRDPGRLGPPSFVQRPAFPIVAATNNSVGVFDPNIQTPWTQSWSIGLQRALSRDMVVELRYVGNKNERAWTEENWNGENIFENGWLEEFRLAQHNLRANVDAGRGETFRYFGPESNTHPLPIMLAHFNGRPFSDAGNQALYTGNNWTNTGIVGDLDPYNPDPFQLAEDFNDDFRTNMGTAGLPINFWVLNPNINAAEVTRSAAGSKYHSMQLEVRRRMSRGLFLSANYSYSYRAGSSLQDLHLPRFYLQSSGAPHIWRGTWQYQIPVGRGRRFGTDMNPWLDSVLGNWEFSGTGRVQIAMTSVNARIVGMSKDELADEFYIRRVKDPVTGEVTIFTMAPDIIENTRKAFSTDPTSATGYSELGPPTGRYLAPWDQPGCIRLFPGDCGTPQTQFINQPPFTRVDMRINKRFPFGRRASAELTLEVLNAFDNINFSHVFDPGDDDDIFTTTGVYTDINTTQDPGGRLGQLIWRINW